MSASDDTVQVRDLAELAFRLLFSSIFIGLGGEHIVDDTLIQNLMPPWVPVPRLASVAAGSVLLVGGGLVAFGYRLRTAAVVLGLFLIVVTATVHVPPVVGLLPTPEGTTEWSWVVLQRSNLVKNLCLLGVCVQLWWHEPGALSLDAFLERAARPDPTQRRPVVLITGASTGLGLAIARRLMTADRYSLVLTARRSSLARFAGVGIEEGPHLRLRALDVTSAAEREAVVAELEAELGGLDILINNAGYSVRAVVEHVTEQDRLAQLDINFRSPMELSRLSLPGMRARRRGRIINISSVGGMMAMPTMSAYSASKFALEGACEALWYEVRPWGVHVVLVEPGFINSDGFEKVRWTDKSRDAMDHASRAYHAHYQHMSAFIGSIMQRAPAGPEDVARQVERAMTMRNPPLRLQATLDARFFAVVRRILPRMAYHRLLYAMLPGIRRWGEPIHSGGDDSRPPS